MDLFLPEQNPIAGQEVPPKTPLPKNINQLGISFDNVPSPQVPTGDFTRSPHYSGHDIIELERDNRPETWMQWGKRYAEAAGLNTLSYSLIEHGLIKQKWNQELSTGNVQMISVKDAKEKYDIDIKEPVPLGVATLMAEMKQEKIRKTEGLFGWDKPFESVAGFLYMGAIYAHMPESIALTAAMSSGLGGIGWGLSSLAGSARALQKINRLRKRVGNNLSNTAKRLKANPESMRGEILRTLEATRPIQDAMKRATPLGAANAVEEYFIYESEKAKGFQYDPYTAVAFGALAPFAFGSVAALAKGRQLRRPQEPVGQTDMGERTEIPLLPPGRETLRLEGQETPYLPPGRTVPQLPPMEVLAGENAFFRITEDNTAIKRRYADARKGLGLGEEPEFLPRGEGLRFGLTERIKARLDAEAKTEKELLGLEARAEFETATKKKISEKTKKLIKDTAEKINTKEGLGEALGATGTARPRGPVKDIRKLKEKVVTEGNYRVINEFRLNVRDRFHNIMNEGGVATPKTLRKLKSDTEALFEFTTNTHDAKVERYNNTNNKYTRNAIEEELPYNEARMSLQRDLIGILDEAIKKGGKINVSRVPEGFQGPGMAIIGRMNNAINKHLPNIRKRLPIDISKEDPEMQDFLGRLEYLETKIPGINNKFSEVAGATGMLGMPQVNVRALFPYLDPDLSPAQFRNMVQAKMQELRRTNQDLSPDNFLSVEQRQLDDYLSSGQGEQRYSPSTSTADAPSGKDFGGDVGMEKMAGIAGELDKIFKKYIKCRMGLLTEAEGQKK